MDDQSAVIYNQTGLNLNKFVVSNNYYEDPSHKDVYPEKKQSANEQMSDEYEYDDVDDYDAEGEGTTLAIMLLKIYRLRYILITFIVFFLYKSYPEEADLLKILRYLICQPIFFGTN